VRSALIASGLALPARRITINLAPADLPKEGFLRLHRQPHTSTIFD
jgi:predicted ATPase with chaperone activity